MSQPDPGPPREQPIDELRCDENGVDLEQLEYHLSLTPAQRLEQNYRARQLVERLREAGRKLYGSAYSDYEETRSG